MVCASTSVRLTVPLRCSPNEHAFVGCPRIRIAVTRPSYGSSVLLFSRRRSSGNSPIASMKKKQNSIKTNADKEDDLNEDAFEALFRQLEEDLKNDDLPISDADDDISEEELAMLERELEEALQDDKLLGALSSTTYEETEVDAIEDNEHIDTDDEEEGHVELKNWQLKRLAYALKVGRRKTNIKNLAADLCLDRAFVLKLLRDPPPHLLMMSANLPDKPVSTIVEPQSSPVEAYQQETTADAEIPQTKDKVPVHVKQSNWSAQKRLKKVQLETLERVYCRTKRPTNAMISSIVHVTNLPRRRVLQWLEERRAEDGVPDSRAPYRRSEPETLISG